MQINSVTSTNINAQKPMINAKSTGYIATAGIGLSMFSGMTNNKFLKQNHKTIAGISGLAVIAHIYFVLSKHKKR